MLPTSAQNHTDLAAPQNLHDTHTGVFQLLLCVKSGQACSFCTGVNRERTGMIVGGVCRPSSKTEAGAWHVAPVLMS